MKLNKKSNLFLTILALIGGSLFIVGCGETSDAEKSEDAVEEASKDAEKAAKDAEKAGKDAAEAIKGIGK